MLRERKEVVDEESYREHEEKGIRQENVDY